VIVPLKVFDFIGHFTRRFQESAFSCQNASGFRQEIFMGVDDRKAWVFKVIPMPVAIA
jgi:hypothetical protein